MKFPIFLSVLAVAAMPALADETEDIGKMQATFGDQAIELPTMIYTSGDDVSPSAYMFAPGGGFTVLSIAGMNMANDRLDIQVDFYPAPPSTGAGAFSLEISYDPTGNGQRWTSDEAPTPAAISFTTLEFDDVQGRAAGTFTGELCYADGYEAEADPGNCKLIEGSFDTQFFME